VQDHAGVAQLVERNLAKVEVASSSLVSRSNKKGKPSFPFCLVARQNVLVGLFGQTRNVLRSTRFWRDSKAVMQRPAKPFRPVRLRLAPPGFKEKAPTLSGLFLFGRRL
jgi:hypothetical protein